MDQNYYDDTISEIPYFTNSNQPIDIKSDTCFTESIYKFLPQIGKGTYKKIECDNFSVNIIDLQLEKDLIIKTKGQEEFLEFSILIEGKQLIKLINSNKNLIYESNQCLLTIINTTDLEYKFSQSSHLKEIRIRISKSMIEYLKIDIKTLDIEHINDLFIKPFPEKCNSILVELISNKHENQNRYMFMVAKIAELLTYYLESTSTQTPYCLILNTITKAKEFINQNIHKQITAKTIADQLRINEKKLKDYFIKTTGISIKQHVLTLKLNKAKQLLRYSEKPIYIIAEEVGYKNATHFTSAFKKHTGVLPKKYRTTL